MNARNPPHDAAIAAPVVAPVAASLDLVAPLDGVAVALSTVSDPVFAGALMGEGLAIEPLSSTLLAPCDGVVTQLARAGHALTLKAANGAEILMHIGIDTVTLGGRGFTPRVAQGERVRQRQVLIEVDLDAIAHEVPSLQTVVVITSPGFELSALAAGRLQAGRTPLLTLTARAGAAAGAGSDVGTDAAVPELRRQATVRHGSGLHARPSALVQAAAREHGAEVRVLFDGRSANARSVTALMALGVAENDIVTVVARGGDAEAAVQAVCRALETASAAGHAAPAAPAAPPPQAGPGLRGVCASPGLALGRVVRLDATAIAVPESGAGLDTEFARLAAALAQARAEIGAAITDADRRRSVAERDIHGAHLALLDDPALIAAAETGILRGRSAGAAFRSSVAHQSALLLDLGQALLAERVGDLRDVERRVLGAMGHAGAAVPALDEASIIVADDLSPSELTRLQRDKLAGLATAAGGTTSHVAILARALGIPALVAVGAALLALRTGQQVLLDADGGCIDPQPGAERMAQAARRIAQQQDRHERELAAAAAGAQTIDGLAIEVAANIASEDDARAAVRHGADGVGLLRTEFLFIDRTEMPTAQEQRQAYQGVLDALQGRPAVIRTIDVGGDKEVPYLTLPAEANPALGLRGIRSGLAQPELLDAQLRGLLTVTPLARLRILIPMVADVGEVRFVRRRIDEIATELGLAERPQLGVMIEVPSAALLADQLARHVDFFSIGTNDLTQYTLAMDRCQAALASRLDAMHPALLRLIAATVQGARPLGRWVGVCGAMASDLEAVPLLVGLGVTELSVSPPLVPEVKALVRRLGAAHCRAEVQALLQLESADAVRAAARRIWPRLDGV
ncbi:MAG: phosphoenolpyruvate--protein phosphotransferase [Burkholderiales bacterium]|nr:phosphoenolpyruvate--protein phosphotransferase [Burkholderiales bacterium]